MISCLFIYSDGVLTMEVALGVPPAPKLFPAGGTSCGTTSTQARHRAEPPADRCNRHSAPVMQMARPRIDWHAEKKHHHVTNPFLAENI